MSGVFLPHDAFARGGGLGSSAAWAYEALCRQPQTKAEIAAAIGLSVQTAKRALDRLVDRGLATQVEGLWTTGPASPDEVAATRGSTGAGADLKARHVAERRLFKGYEEHEDGHLSFAPLKQKPVDCSAYTDSGRPCQAKAVRGDTQCATHLRRQTRACPDDHAWADAMEADLAMEYERQYLP